MIMENSNRIIVEDFYAYVTDIKSCFNNTLQIHFPENNMFVEDKEFLNFINVDSIPNKLNMVFYEIETSGDSEVSETTTAIDLYTLSYENNIWRERRVFKDNYTRYASKEITALITQKNIQIRSKESIEDNKYIHPMILKGDFEQNKDTIVRLYFEYILKPVITKLELDKPDNKSVKNKLSSFDDVVNKDLEELLDLEEGQYLEFKENSFWLQEKEEVLKKERESQKQNYKPGTVIDLRDTILKAICAFGNSEGGIILIGVIDPKNGGGVCGIAEDRNLDKLADNDSFELFWKDTIKEHIDLWSSLNTEIEFDLYEKKEIVKFIVQPRKKDQGYCETTYFGEKKIFVRDGPRNLPIKQTDALKQFRDRF